MHPPGDTDIRPITKPHAPRIHPHIALLRRPVSPGPLRSQSVRRSVGIRNGCVDSIRSATPRGRPAPHRQGRLPAPEPGGADLFFRLVSARYGAGPIIPTSSKRLRDWPQILAGDEILTTAILDGLLAQEPDHSAPGMEGTRLRHREEG